MNLEKLEYYLSELVDDLDGTCWEVQTIIIEPLKRCTKLLECFEVTERGREVQTVLTSVLEEVESLTQHWQSRANRITRILSGKNEIEYPPPLAIIG